MNTLYNKWQIRALGHDFTELVFQICFEEKSVKCL